MPPTHRITPHAFPRALVCLLGVVLIAAICILLVRQQHATRAAATYTALRAAEARAANAATPELKQGMAAVYQRAMDLLDNLPHRALDTPQPCGAVAFPIGPAAALFTVAWLETGFTVQGIELLANDDQSTRVIARSDGWDLARNPELTDRSRGTLLRELSVTVSTHAEPDRPYHLHLPDPNALRGDLSLRLLTPAGPTEAAPLHRPRLDDLIQRLEQHALQATPNGPKAGA